MHSTEGNKENDWEASCRGMAAACHERDVESFCSVIASRHTHMLPLAPYRTSHRRKVTRLSEHIATSLHSLPSGDGEATPAVVRFVVRCVNHMVAVPDFNTTVSQFGNVVSCVCGAAITCCGITTENSRTTGCSIACGSGSRSRCGSAVVDVVETEPQQMPCSDPSALRRALYSLRKWLDDGTVNPQAVCQLITLVSALGPVLPSQCLQCGSGAGAACAYPHVQPHMVAGFVTSRGRRLRDAPWLVKLLQCVPSAVAFVSASALKMLFSHLVQHLQDHAAVRMLLALCLGLPLGECRGDTDGESPGTTTAGGREAQPSGVVALDALVASRQFEVLRMLMKRHPWLQTRYPEAAFALAKFTLETHLAARRFDAAVAMCREYPGAASASLSPPSSQVLEEGPPALSRREALTEHLVRTASQTNPLLARALAASLHVSAAQLAAWSPLPSTSSSPGGTTTTHASAFLRLELPPSQVHVVDSIPAIVAMQDTLHTAVFRAQEAAPAAACVPVGLDAEWRPVFTRAAMGSEGSPEVGTPVPALLQIAVSSDAFLVDVQSLLVTAVPPLRSAAARALHTTLTWLFRCKEVVIVGFAVDGDFGYLAAAFPDVPSFGFAKVRVGLFGVCSCTSLCRGSHVADITLCVWDSRQNVLDLRDVAASSVVKRCFGEHMASGLSGLCRAVLGARLDKRAQLSDWECRPLHKLQVQYAAQDAHVLVRLELALRGAVGLDTLRSLWRPWKAATLSPPTSHRDRTRVASEAIAGMAKCATHATPPRSSTSSTGCCSGRLFPLQDELHVRFHLLLASTSGHRRRRRTKDMRGARTISSHTSDGHTNVVLGPPNVGVSCAIWQPFTESRLESVFTPPTVRVGVFLQHATENKQIGSHMCMVQCGTTPAAPQHWRMASAAGMAAVATALQLSTGAVVKSVALMCGDRPVVRGGFVVFCVRCSSFASNCGHRAACHGDKCVNSWLLWVVHTI